MPLSKHCMRVHTYAEWQLIKCHWLCMLNFSSPLLPSSFFFSIFYFILLIFFFISLFVNSIANNRRWRARQRRRENSRKKERKKYIKYTWYLCACLFWNSKAKAWENIEKTTTHEIVHEREEKTNQERVINNQIESNRIDLQSIECNDTSILSEVFVVVDFQCSYWSVLMIISILSRLGANRTQSASLQALK